MIDETDTVTVVLQVPAAAFWWLGGGTIEGFWCAHGRMEQLIRDEARRVAWLLSAGAESGTGAAAADSSRDGPVTRLEEGGE